MTIFGVDYREASYTPVTGWRRAWPLAKLEFLALFRGKWGVVLFVFCALPSIRQLFFLLIWTGALGFGQRDTMGGLDGLKQFVPSNSHFYVESIVAPENGLFVFMLLTALTTARVIAKDRATNALEFYWTRGISPRGYFAAKWLGSAMLVGLLTVLAPLVLWVMGALLADDWTFVEQTAGFMPGALAGLAFFTLVTTGLCTLLSAIVGTANLATILWCLLLGGGLAVSEMINELVDTRVESWTSVWGAASAVTRALGGIPDRHANVGGALGLLALLGLALLVLAWRRLRVQGAVG